ncbi:RNA polymerase II degradation factor 1 isoform X2 [Drosophila rhopaloa]|uniref:RNA polymerase II degradation factor 1 isoform X2 n=1 Tax=Drosophila rhopaloa TaxID=1041015 RepID=A0A6P4FP51_DRORH|nr:RNA polymerase II degradation factor 1 isoform X2 [Drosophila rhopaloa]
MSLETETAAGAKDQHQHDHIDEDEVSELQKSRSFYDRVREQAERFASTQIGQFVIERADRALVMIEDTAKWSLPQEKSAAPLERPLPWGPFLLLIILLRLTRIWLSVGALMIGNGPVSPSDMVYFIQTRRRKLRAVRTHGLKVMRHRQQEVSYGSGKGLTHKVTQWFSRAICRPGVQQDNNTRPVFVRHSEQGLNTSSVVKRPREEDSNADHDPDHNLTIDQMLAKYANDNSEDDSDFVPNEEEDDSSSTSEESESETHSSEGMSSNEVEELVEQAKQKPANAVVENGVHKAEEKENDKGKLNITTTSNGNNDKEKAEVADQRDEEWKSSPGHMSAAMMNTRLYNNTAAAASTDSEPETDPEPQSEPPSQSQPENEEYDEEEEDSCSTSGSSQTGSTVYQRDVQDNETQPDTQTEQILDPTAPQLSNYPTVDTLTPATSSEDIFYSPIGSPTCFNTSLGTQALLKRASIQSVLAHSTPTSVLKDPPTEMVNASISQTPEPEPLQPQKEVHTPNPQQQQQQQQQQPQQQQQQQQRQRNHSHQRYRGRNRR